MRFYVSRPTIHFDGSLTQNELDAIKEFLKHPADNTWHDQVAKGLHILSLMFLHEGNEPQTTNADSTDAP